MKHRKPRGETLERRSLLTTVFTFSFNGPHGTHGLTAADVRQSVSEAFSYYEKAADVDLRLVPSGGAYGISSRTIYLGGGVHARGLANPSARQIYFHNGVLPPGTHSGKLAPKNQTALWRAVSQPSLSKILAHEIGHQYAFFGLGHSHNIDCLMHSHAKATELCPAEKAVLHRKYGAPRAELPPDPIPIPQPTPTPQPVGRPPTAMIDQVITDWYSDGISVDVLANDSDPDGNDLEMTRVWQHPKGTAEIRGNEVHFTPKPGEHGIAVIQYEIADGTYTARGLLEVEIRQVVLFSWQNHRDRFDVGNDHRVTAADALFVINRIGMVAELDERPPKHGEHRPIYPDVNGDREVTALDALLVINQLARLEQKQET